MVAWKTGLTGVILAIFVVNLPSLLQRRPPTNGEGFAAPGWRGVADVFKKLVENGQEQGGAFAIYHKGELVVEFSGGYADDEALYPFRKNTLTWTFSSAKAVAAIVIAMLVERGLLSYEAPVAQYWPEFAQNGKEHITVEQLLSHQAGLAVIDTQFSAWDLQKDPEKVAALLAKQKPNWKPGTGHGYHAVTIGLYEDQLLQRVDPRHRDMSQFFTEEVAEPFGIDFYFGLPLEESYRCARVHEMNIFGFDVLRGHRYWPAVWAFLTQPNSIIQRTMVNPVEISTEGLVNNPEYRNLLSPATHGFASAQGLAKLMGVVASGSRNGQKVISHTNMQKLLEPLVSGVDLSLLLNITYGRGVTIRDTPTGGFMFGAPGAGGQMAYADPRHELGWAYLTNYQSLFTIGDDPRYLALEAAMYNAVQEIESK